MADPSKWDATAASKLKGVPQRFVDVIRACQPFQRPPEERERDGLLVLHQLDVQDKHRLALATDTTLVGFELDNAGIEFASEDAAARNNPPDQTVHPDTALRDGALLMVHRTIDPIVSVKGSLQLAVQVGLRIEEEFVPVQELVVGLANLATEAIRHLEAASGAPGRG